MANLLMLNGITNLKKLNIDNVQLLHQPGVFVHHPVTSSNSS